MPGKWESASSRLKREIDSALRAFAYGLGPTGKGKSVAKGRDRVRNEADRLVAGLSKEALKLKLAESDAWAWAPEWLGPGGRPQERSFSVITGCWWWGDDFETLLGELGRASVEALAAGRVPAFAVRIPARESDS